MSKTTATTETRSFETEVCSCRISSFTEAYGNKEIFPRAGSERVDAGDKLRFEALTDGVSS